MGFHRTSDKSPEQYELITREDAASKARRYFFTGKPCKHGHVSPRYVSTGGCLGCLNKWRNLQAKNAFSKDLIPWDKPRPFWRSKRLTAEQLVELEKYVQRCIETFEASVLPPLCSRCDGVRYVPAGNGRNDWIVCPACEDHVPSTADSVPTGTTE